MRYAKPAVFKILHCVQDDIIVLRLTMLCHSEE